MIDFRPQERHDRKRKIWVEEYLPMKRSPFDPHRRGKLVDDTIFRPW